MTIAQLEESNASLRLLITLNQINKQIMLSNLYEEMHKRYGLGRRAVDTALEVCIKLDLIKREIQRIGKNPMPSIFHSLTAKGKKIAKICLELEQALS